MQNPDYERLPLFDDILRDYQRAGNLRIRESFRRGHKAVLLSIPTGMGKTTQCVALPREGARVMVMVPADALVRQTVDTIRRLRQRVAVIEQAFDKAEAGDEWVVATIQSLLSDGRYRRFVGHVDLIVVDECDTFFTIKVREMLQEFIGGGARVLGVTATPYRGDKASLFGFYEDCPFSLELRDAFRDGWLVKPKVWTHRVRSLNFDALTKTRVDFKPEEIEGLLCSEQVEHDIANLILRCHKGTHGVIRCRSVRQAQRLREILVTRYGQKVSCVWGTQNDEERQEEIARFVSGENTLVTNCRVLGRGWDCPQVRAIYNASPTKNKATFMQALGRGTRALTGTLDGKHTREERLAAIAASDKPWWLWHDLTNTCRFHSPVTAIEMLLAGPRDMVQKVRESHDEEGDEAPVDLEALDEEMQAEIRQHEEQERLARELEKQRRAQLVVGVTFDSRSRDLFAAPDVKTPAVRGWRMPWGKYRGRPVRDPVVPLDYLRWYLGKQSSAKWITVIGQEIERREAARPAVPDPVVPW
jgi:superfamily II DNA or RNA helicase